MKKLLIALMICGLAFMAMADGVGTVTDDESFTLTINIESICWLTLDNDDDANKMWSISEADFRTAGTGTGLGSAGSGINADLGSADDTILGFYNSEQGDPNSSATFATDGVDANTDAANQAAAIRVSVDSNDEDGYKVELKASGDFASVGTPGETIPMEQCAWWTYDGVYNNVNNEAYGGDATGSTSAVSDWTEVGPAAYQAATSKVLSANDQVIMQTDAEGANVTSLNFGLTLYTLDAFKDDYTTQITLTATNL